MNDTDM